MPTGIIMAINGCGTDIGLCDIYLKVNVNCQTGALYSYFKYHLDGNEIIHVTGVMLRLTIRIKIK